jgi:hypothetical protein
VWICAWKKKYGPTNYSNFSTCTTTHPFIASPLNNKAKQRPHSKDQTFVFSVLMGVALIGIINWKLHQYPSLVC